MSGAQRGPGPNVVNAITIVSDLAKLPSPTDFEMGECFLCGEYCPTDRGIDAHHPTCPWRRAVEVTKKGEI